MDGHKKALQDVEEERRRMEVSMVDIEEADDDPEI